MIDLRKKDPVAESIKEIMEKELSAKQKKIAKMAGDPENIDAKDLEALRSGKKPVEEGWDDMMKDVENRRKPQPSGGSGVKQGTRYGGSKQKDKPEHDEDKMKKEDVEQVDEGMKEALKKLGQKTFKAMTGGSDEDQLQALKKRMYKPEPAKKPTSEEVEQIDELSKSTLGSYAKKATRDARLKHGMGKDFESLSKSLRKPGYKAGAKEWEDKYKSDARKREAGVNKAIDRLAKEEVELDEKAPPGFEGTVKAMKKHKDIDNPFALSWYMKKKGYKSHKKSDGSDK